MFSSSLCLATFPPIPDSISQLSSYALQAEVDVAAPMHTGRCAQPTRFVTCSKRASAESVRRMRKKAMTVSCSVLLPFQYHFTTPMPSHMHRGHGREINYHFTTPCRLTFIEATTVRSTTTSLPPCRLTYIQVTAVRCMHRGHGREIDYHFTTPMPSHIHRGHGREIKASLLLYIIHARLQSHIALMPCLLRCKLPFVHFQNWRCCSRLRWT